VEIILAMLPDQKSGCKLGLHRKLEESSYFEPLLDSLDVDVVFVDYPVGYPSLLQWNGIDFTFEFERPNSASFLLQFGKRSDAVLHPVDEFLFHLGREAVDFSSFKALFVLI
jgi:hypothetical protein